MVSYEMGLIFFEIHNQSKFSQSFVESIPFFIRWEHSNQNFDKHFDKKKNKHLAEVILINTLEIEA
jgi:hypothetical protein